MDKRTFVAVTAITWGLLILVCINQRRLNLKLNNFSTGVTPAEQFNRLEKQLAALETFLSNVVRQAESAEVRNVEATRRRTAYLPGRVEPRDPDVLIEPPGLPSPAIPPGTPGKRPWGPEQVTGAPDTLQAGDQTTAWAPLEQDAGPEWLKVDYARDVSIAEVRVRETYNPGAVVRLTGVLPDGRESLIWEGSEPPAQAPVDRSFLPKFGNVQARSVKIYLDTKKVSGWNEIDAVELIGSHGTRQWATNATASSTYAEQSGRGLRALQF